MILKIHCLKAVNPTEHMKELLSKKVTAALINSQVQNEAALINFQVQNKAQGKNTTSHNWIELHNVTII